MQKALRNIHYILLQEDYYTSRHLRQMIDLLRPEYEFTGNTLPSLGNSFEQYLSDVDLVIADLQLAEGVFLNLMPPEHCRKPVIICAENNSFFSEMKHYNLIDYVLKPVSREDMEKSLNKFEEYYQLNSKNI